MADDLIVEVLDQNWVRKAITNGATSARITEELGAIGDAQVEVPIDDQVGPHLPDPDAANPYEGRFRVYEDADLVFAGVIDAKTMKIGSDGAGIQFEGKQRGIELGFYNTGRVDYMGWFLPELVEELLRNNIARESVLVSVTSQEELYGAYQMTTGDPFKQNYWKTTSSTPTHTATFDLGESRMITGIRVFPQWWKDIDTNRFHYHNYTVDTSVDGTNWTQRANQTGNNYPATIRGNFWEFAPVAARYWRINVTGSSDGYARIAQVMIYQDIAQIGPDTTWNVPFIENDDSGNVSTSGSTTRPIVPGAFQGDGVITHSYVTKLAAGGSITHTFRGISDAVFFTSHTDGAGVADIYVDNVFRQQISIPNNKYWYKGYDTVDDIGEMADAVHTLRVEYVSGSVQVDYFNGIYSTSWRPIEADDQSIGYLGSWSEVEGDYFFNFYAAQSEVVGNQMFYWFRGDRVKLMGSKGSGFGSFTWSIDSGTETTVNCSAVTQTNKETLLDWSGSYGTHRLRVTHSAAGKLLLDRLEGNFAHTMYIRARYEPNLKVLQRVSEIADSWLRFNHDGTVDFLGTVGNYGGTTVREGENEGGVIVSANVENDYSETGSAVLAIVNVNGELPIKAFVIDKEAVEEIGFKVIKWEQSDAADQFLLNRQALQYLREKRKPTRSYNLSFDPDQVQGDLVVGDTTQLYAPTVGLNGSNRHRIGHMTKEYVRT